MYTLILYMWDVQYTSKVWNQEDFLCFWKKPLTLTNAAFILFNAVFYLFNHNIVKYYYI